MSRLPDAPAAPRWLQRVLCLDDFENEARRHLPRPVFGYVAGAAETNQSFRANRDAFQAWQMVPRVLVDITPRDMGVELCGRRWATPFGVAPMGLAALSAYRGDLVIAQAARRENIPFVLSGSSLIRMEEVIAVNPDAWFQAYLPGDDAGILALLDRVKAAGFRTLVITLDTPAAANRESNLRAGFTIPVRPGPRLAWQGITHPRWLFGTFLRTLVQHGMPHFENSYATRGAPILSPNVERNLSDRGHLNWRHLQMIRRVWSGEIVVKGVLDARDARRAADEGCNGVIVSNHGGRQLDGAAAPLAVLPRIVEACPDIPVMLDSGVRRGSDVLKALALGARFVFVGRPFAFAAAVAGEAGALRAIDLLRSEVSRNMALMGVLRPDELDPSHLIPAQGH
ncbi:MAG: alpha-hydroxy-acid oxidizing protein [Hydrogenophaga sp.]|uniref:alpha-hydroxy acid oxidase n=1 Tax=Hydrogenophaga sp. TaxID=1904254 RepID=UPI0016BA0C19|nr:alpha-hydroxy acid oxidase [Hydrogenophaga sp.]NIM43316.1 alpha-hydroxy-acid oxidizing protein [Hydrogenophaga sp.]NIN28385.1 alpha-hydroxy-acid oxidizing protein [Hydrogenophaga sp.]NIN29204.1 alpha-hydroxy-acid oxidizing protein [Hydrogenophaga sp.]NIN57519.1 alpha-hydroxy-acid oxidizing protein [Hydrogenophaga sp.]NIO53814.1 alpha-hydroxy-acid oxidizing protein [Hydrogenophaga sp.]